MVEQGTARGSRNVNLAVAGKTGTAQNSHGKDHGWFIGFAPADNPVLVVGAIMEAAEHGTNVAPYVVKALSRYVLGPPRPHPHRPTCSCRWTARRATCPPPTPGVAAPVALRNTGVTP